MTYIEDYGLDAPARSLTLLALSLVDETFKKTMNILHIQKVIKYFEYLINKQDVDYSNYSLGAVSYEIQENLVTLKEVGLVKQLDSEYMLDPEGERAVSELTNMYTEKELRTLHYAKNKLNPLSDDELMFFMYTIIPKTQKYSTEYARLLKSKDRLIRGLFLKGAICSDEEFKMFGIKKEELIETMAITEDKEFMEAVKKGCEDVKRGRVKPFKELLAKHGLD
jgi:hypothetical protein